MLLIYKSQWSLYTETGRHKKVLDLSSGIELIYFQVEGVLAEMLLLRWQQQEWLMLVCGQGTAPTAMTNQTYGTLESVQVAHTQHV